MTGFIDSGVKEIIKRLPKSVDWEKLIEQSEIVPAFKKLLAGALDIDASDISDKQVAHEVASSIKEIQDMTDELKAALPTKVRRQ